MALNPRATEFIPSWLQPQYTLEDFIADEQRREAREAEAAARQAAAERQAQAEREAAAAAVEREARFAAAVQSHETAFQNRLCLLIRVTCRGRPYYVTVVLGDESETSVSERLCEITEREYDNISRLSQDGRVVIMPPRGLQQDSQLRDAFVEVMQSFPAIPQRIVLEYNDIINFNAALAATGLQQVDSLPMEDGIYLVQYSRIEELFADCDQSGGSIISAAVYEASENSYWTDNVMRTYLYTPFDDVDVDDDEGIEDDDEYEDVPRSDYDDGIEDVRDDEESIFDMVYPVTTAVLEVFARSLQSVYPEEPESFLFL